MKVFLKIAVISCLLLFVASCAYSPQQVTISPVISTDAEAYGNGRPVLIEVKDSRASKILGSRGGVYKDTSVITLANDLTQAIAKAAKAKLAVQGFNVNSTVVENTTKLTIFIERLSYDIPEQTAGKKIVLAALLKAQVEAGGEVYTGTYTTNTEKQTVVTPTMARNEKMINALLSDTLVRLFSDPKLKAFLSNI